MYLLRTVSVGLKKIGNRRQFLRIKTLFTNSIVIQQENEITGYVHSTARVLKTATRARKLQ